jgi:alanine racemase
MDAVRVGTLLFGQYPTRGLAKKFGKKLALQETWKFQARVIAVRRLPAGSKIGYGWEFRPRRPVTIAVVSAGLADGLGMQPASLLRRGWKGALKALAGRQSAGLATIHGQPAPVVGRIAMQLATIDVTALPDVNIGDVVTLPVRRLAVGSGIHRIFLP